ncbi:protein phosphatase 1 regulatory subunit 3B-like [Branchiostoma lanceolatum]|uniref:Protein phosphatase 1 regulatory subunit n=1 Tax=Branchiostoma lanceolatum TaxID=7740 RepID=A0A8J9ZN55_BRALA|nr:PPP1R3B [Branchiostoma lanceolatum]
MLAIRSPVAAMPVDCGFMFPPSPSPPHIGYLNASGLLRDLEKLRLRSQMTKPPYSKCRTTLLTPLKPCINRAEEPKHVASSCRGKGKEKARKKKVSFADTQGLSLVNVRLVEDTEEPPVLSSSLIAAVIDGARPAAEQRSNLVFNFAQPAADYLRMRQRLDRQNVCLENAIIKEKSIMGTVKVKNLAFEKHLEVRVTFDGWNTYKDLEASYSSSEGKNYDTFSFEFDVPTHLQPQNKIEFCLAYTSGGQTHWDSNDGQNYQIVSTEWKSMQEITRPWTRADSRDNTALMSDYVSPEFPTWAAHAKSDIPYY